MAAVFVISHNRHTPCRDIVFHNISKYFRTFSYFFALVSKKYCTFARGFKKTKIQSGCSAVGSALRSGRRGRAFESPHPDNSGVKTLIYSVLTLVALKMVGRNSERF